MKIVVKARPAAVTTSLVVAPERLRIAARPLRTLDLDVECRPLHFYGDLVSKEITAIAWAWTDAPTDVTCLLLGEHDLPSMLRAFAEVYRQADLITGHFIRGFDLPLLNGAMTEFELPALPARLTHDTKLDLMKRSGLSGSQENIAAMLGLAHPKVSMNQAKWRAANRLTPEGLALVKERVVGDVTQHLEMRDRLLSLGYLGPPRWWRAHDGITPDYTP